MDQKFDDRGKFLSGALRPDPSPARVELLEAVFAHKGIVGSSFIEAYLDPLRAPEMQSVQVERIQEGRIDSAEVRVYSGSGSVTYSWLVHLDDGSALATRGRNESIDAVLIQVNDFLATTNDLELRLRNDRGPGAATPRVSEKFVAFLASVRQIDFGNPLLGPDDRKIVEEGLMYALIEPGCQEALFECLLEKGCVERTQAVSDQMADEIVLVGLTSISDKELCDLLLNRAGQNCINAKLVCRAVDPGSVWSSVHDAIGRLLMTECKVPLAEEVLRRFREQQNFDESDGQL